MEQNRRPHVRLKIVALLAALTALWAFAAVVTAQEGAQALAARIVEHEVNQPTSRLIEALQLARRLSGAGLGGAGAAGAALPAGRAATDQALTDWQRRLAATSVELAAGDALAGELAATADALAGLDQLRAGVDDERLDRAAAQDGFTAMIEAAFAVYGAADGVNDRDLTRQVGALVTLAHAREVLSRQDALLSGALAAGQLDAGDLARFTQWVGVRRFLYAEAAAGLPASDQAALAEVLAAPAVAELRRTEDLVVEQAAPGSAPPLTAASWRGAADPALAALAELERVLTDRALDQAGDAQLRAIVWLALVGGLGLVIVLAAVVVAVTTTRTLTRQVRKLRDAAHELAQQRLPQVMARLSAGEPVDVAAEAPPLRFGDGELGQVGQAFNLVQEAAVRAAVSQAELRRGVRDVFLSLARRTQNLVHKQLTVLDGMERRETDGDKMGELYRVDHLATRMRRNAENLIVLSGARPGRTWRRPVPMIDVIRGAMAEVEDYTRVVLLPVDPAALDGRAVGDLIHLLAELIENAASFSPPYAKVSVGGERVAHGYAVAVEDRGLGMTEAELAAANEKLSQPGDFDLADASHLGHYVVAKLAQRHGVRVQLRRSPYGGITAIVLVPSALLVGTPEEERPAGADPAEERTGAPAGEDVVAAVAELGGSATAAARTSGNGTDPPDPDAAARPGAADAPVLPLVHQRRPDTSPDHHPDHMHPDRMSWWDTATAERAAADLTAARSPAGPAIGGLTAAGLPCRTPQTSLPPTGTEPAEDSAEPALPDPERARLTMRAYQRGTLRGRATRAGDEQGSHDESTGDAGGVPTPDPPTDQEG